MAEDRQNTPKAGALDSGGRLIPVPLASLRVDTTTRFNIYLRSSPHTPPTVYREKNLPFTEQEQKDLEGHNVEQVYIESGEHGEYQRYTGENLGAILEDEGIRSSAKSEIVYGSAQHLMQEVMADPRAGEVLPRSKRMVEHTLEFMVKDRSAFQNIVKVLSRDYRTYTHSVNVFVFGVGLLQRLGVNDPATLKEFGYGALLHDVGKSMIDPAIVNRRGRLTKQQWEIMKLHPVYGYDILMEQGGFESITFDIVRHHHEKLRGAGYPDDLNGDQISSWVRVCTIADVFDALTTNRLHKGAVKSFDALTLMRKEMIADLDTEFFREFVELMGNPDG